MSTTPRSPAERFAQPVVGDSYRLPVKIMALLITACVAVAIIGAIGVGGATDSAALLLLLGGGIGMGLGCYHIVWGKTRIDAEGIRQDWIFARFYRWEDIFKAKVLRLPMGTRLVLTTARPPFKSVHAGTRELEEAFEDIELMFPGRLPTGDR